MRVYLLLGAVAAALAGAATATAAGRGPITPKANRTPPTFVIKGRGWGHGIGLAQYGALGYARHGVSYKRILKHYYPRTKPALTKMKQVRVLLADGRSRVEIFSRTTFRVRDADDVSYRLAPGHYKIGPRLKVKVDPGKPAQPLPGPLFFTPGRAPIVLDRPYRGSMQVSSAGGAVRAINFVGMEEYVRGVVPDEVPDEWPAAALKAQAVAARSYAVATRKRDGPFDVYADTRSQVYGGVDAEEFSTNAAVEATAGQIVTYRGKPAVTYFFASSGGRTAAIQDAWPGSTPVPYLVSVQDPYDSASPYHRWGPYSFTAGDLARRLGLSAKPLDARTKRNRSKRVSRVTFKTASGNEKRLGPDIREGLDLRSTWFSIGVLVVDRPAKPLTYGVRSTLTGLARGVGHLRLEQRLDGAWERAAAVKRRGGGSFVARVKATSSRKYRLSNGKVSSRPIMIGVAPLVRLDPPPDESSLTGTVKPLLTGKTVTIQRRSDLQWVRVSRATVDEDGDFRAELDLRPGTYRARLAPGGGLVPGTSRILRVVQAKARRPSEVRYLSFSPSDPLASRQWYLEQVRAFDFWPEMPALPGVRVAVVDSGIDGGHPEFKGRIVAAKSFVGGSPRSDKVGHGTFVAGEIAAATDNDVGIAGIGLPAELLIAKVVRTDRTISVRAEARAIKWAVRHGARVINLSLSGLRDPLDTRRDTYSPIEAAAVRYAYRKGVVVVAAVGNSDQAPRSPWNFAGYPAALPHVVGVSALNRSAGVPGYSNRDVLYNDLSAPGSDIFSTVPRGLTDGSDCVDVGYSSCGPSEFRHAAGTSFSAPMISAAAALMLALRPSLSPSQVSYALERSAKDMTGATGCRPCPRGRDRLTGWGRLDVTAALGLATSGTLPRKDVREPNDEAAGQASTIRGRKHRVLGTLDYWDDPIDVYRVRLRRGQHLSASLHGPARGDSNLLLWKPGTRRVDDLSPEAQSKRVAGSSRSGSIQNIRRYRARVGGWYFLEARVTSKSAGPYSLRFKKSR